MKKNDSILSQKVELKASDILVGFIQGILLNDYQLKESSISNHENEDGTTTTEFNFKIER